MNVYSSTQLIMLLLVSLLILSSVQCLRSCNTCTVSRQLDSKSLILHLTHFTGTGYTLFHHHSYNNKVHVSSRLCDIRGGFVAADSLTSSHLNILSKASEYILSNPTNLFNSLLASLVCLTLLLKYVDNKSISSRSVDAKIVKPAEVKSLQFRFLMVFWLMRMAGRN